PPPRQAEGRRSGPGAGHRGPALLPASPGIRRGTPVRLRGPGRSGRLPGPARPGGGGPPHRGRRAQRGPGRVDGTGAAARGRDRSVEGVRLARVAVATLTDLLTSKI